MGIRVLRGQVQPVFCVFIGGGGGGVCHQTGIAHPGVPVGVVLPLGADGLQQVNGVPDESPVHCTVGPMRSMIPQHRQIAVSPAQLDGQKITPLLLRDSFDGLNTSGELVRIIPLFKQLRQLCCLRLIHDFTAFPVSPLYIRTNGAFFQCSIHSDHMAPEHIIVLIPGGKTPAGGRPKTQ